MASGRGLTAPVGGPGLLLWVLCILQTAAFSSAQPGSADAPALATDAASLEQLVATVSTPEELVPAVQTNKPHIVINEHLNLTGLPALVDSTGTDSVVAATASTRSMRGNCSQPSNLTHPDYPWRPGQCVLTVREDWLQLDVNQLDFWLHSIYVRVVGNATGGHGEATLVGNQRANLYMTDVTMVGTGKKGRAVDVAEGRAMYARDSRFALFDKDKQSAVRLKKASTGTFVRCHFQDSRAFTRDVEKQPVGPAVGLEHDNDNATVPGAYAWFQDCTFDNLTTSHAFPDYGTPAHDVAIADSQARAFTNTPHAPLLYNRETEAIEAPVVVGPAPPGARGDAGVFGGRTFLTEGDEFFTSVSQVDVGTPAIERVASPDPGSLITYEAGGDDDDNDGTVTALAVVVGVLGCLLTTALCALCCMCWRNRAGKRGTCGRKSAATYKGATEHESDDIHKEAGGKGTVSPDAVVRLQSPGRSVFQSGSQHSSGTFAASATEIPAAGGAGGHTTARSGAPGSAALTPESTLAASSHVEGLRGSGMLNVKSESHQRSSLKSVMTSGSVTTGASSHHRTPLTTSTIPTQSTVEGPATASTRRGVRHWDEDFRGAPPRPQVYSGSGPSSNTNELGVTSDRQTDTTQDPWTPGAARRAEPSPSQVVEMLASVHADVAPFEGRYKLRGPLERVRSNTAIVQLADAASDDAPSSGYVLKFYNERRVFDRVAALAANPNLRGITWPIEDLVPNDWRRAHAGHVLPACAVIRCGETLEAWLSRTQRDEGAMVSALAAVARVVMELHAANHVAVGLTPRNVAFFEDEGKWALIDYKRVTRDGNGATLSHHAHYLAPELVSATSAAASEEGAAAVSDASDVWALGLIAYETLTGRRAFAASVRDAELRAMIVGKEPLPWEITDPDCLGSMRASVMQCLSRAPSDRPKAESLAQQWGAGAE